MRIIQDLQKYLNFIDQDSLAQEKAYLEREIQFFTSKVQLLKDQILDTQTLQPAQTQELEREFQALIEQVRLLLGINQELSNLQTQVLVEKELSNKRFSELFELFLIVEDMIHEQDAHYTNFEFDTQSDNQSNLQSNNELNIKGSCKEFVASFRTYVSKKCSSNTLDSIQSRLNSMSRKAEQFTKSNHKLEIAIANLNQYLETISNLELLVNIQTPSAELEIPHTPTPQLLIGQITPILETLHQENLEKIKVQTALEIQARQQKFLNNLNSAKQRLQLIALLAAIPAASAILYSKLQLQDSNPVPQTQASSNPTPNLAQDFQLNSNPRPSLRTRDLGFQFQDQVMERMSEMNNLKEAQRLQQANQEFELFKASLQTSPFLEYSTPAHINLYSYQGASRIHYLFFVTPDDFYTFEAQNENAANIQHSINTIYGPHQSLTLSNYQHNPDSQLRKSALSRKLY